MRGSKNNIEIYVSKINSNSGLLFIYITSRSENPVPYINHVMIKKCYDNNLIDMYLYGPKYCHEYQN